jgi:oligopeptide transport system permease protein
MVRFIIRRLLQMVLTFFGATLIVYALMFSNQGSPERVIQSLVGERPLNPAQLQALTERYHLDEGFWGQYGYYMKGLLTGDFGTSLTGRPIADMLSGAWPITVRLAIIGVLFAILLGVTAGVVAGIRRGGVFDNATLALVLLLISIPIIVLAPVAQLVFGIKLGWFPPTAGAEPSWHALLLPGMVLGSFSLATYSRLTRTSVAENLRSDYVRTAKAKGLPRKRVIGVHVVRNSLIPVITYIGIDIGGLMSGAIVTEGVYNIPGVGFNLFRGIRTEDGPLVVGFVSILVIVFLVANLIVDIMYAVLDPRIRYE